MKLPLVFRPILTLLLFPSAVFAGSATWVGGNSGNWGDAVKWGGSTFPNGAGEVATFNNSSFFASGGTIVMATSGGTDTSITIGSWSKVSSSSGRSVTLNNVAGGTGFLIFDSSSGNAIYSSDSGNAAVIDTINVGIQLNDPLTVTGSTRSIRFRNTISESGGAQSITKTGAWVLRLEGSSANTFSGGFIINNGTVSAEKSGAMGTGNISVAETSGTTNATLSITTGVLNAVADSATLSLSSFTGNFSTVTLATGVNETVGGLFFDGIAQAAGTWGATGSGATFINDNWFTGTGIITVVPEPNAGVFLVVGLAGLAIFQRRRARI